MTTTSDPAKRLHHVGIVVASLQAEIDGYAKSLGASADVPIFYDPLQKVRVAFLHPGTGATAAVELVEPAAADSPVSRFAAAGGGLHHLCYEVDDLDASLLESRRAGSFVVRAPAPAVAFDQRRIAWVLTRQKLLVEFLERATVRGADEPPDRSFSPAQACHV